MANFFPFERQRRYMLQDKGTREGKPPVAVVFVAISIGLLLRNAICTMYRAHNLLLGFTDEGWKGKRNERVLEEFFGMLRNGCDSLMYITLP